MIIAIPLIMLAILPEKTHAAEADLRAGEVWVSGGWLNLRSRPSASSEKIGALSKGSRITLLSISGSWWKVEYADNKYGYCHADYIRPVSSNTAAVTIESGSLNVRSGPGTGYRRLDRLYKGEEVLVLSESKGWSEILYRGSETGYVSSQYISGYYAPVSNSVPSMKQTDPRWADKIIGSSGKTFAQIGCATTAIAMMESARRGDVIYPHEMALQLRYTPSGSVYWPGDYIAVTHADGYAEKIYEILKQGKAVLFGARNRYGTQHYVVITGFSGGDSLSPASFQIHDPGTYSRTNLQQLLDAYPNFYKFFYY